jgi:hypothetical protein
MLKQILFLLIISGSFTTLRFTRNNSELSRISLDLTIQPDSGYIAGIMSCEEVPDTVFYLYRGFSLKSVTANGHEVRYKRLQDINESISTAYQISPARGNLIIKFSGKIGLEDLSRLKGGYNSIGPDLVELSDFFNWYPHFKQQSPVQYSFSIDLPKNFNCVTNAFLEKTDTIRGRFITQWHFEKPLNNIILLAFPGMKMKYGESGEYKIEVYYKWLSESYIDSMITDLGKTVELYTGFYNKPGSNNLIRICYSPRSAGGYARAPVIVVSEKFALEQRTSKWGYARDFRLNAHELAHYWSRANTSTADDWMNEGFAEFSALLASKKIIGNEFSDLLITEYEGIVKNAKTDISIMETDAGTWEREINRYYRPALLLDKLLVRYGCERIQYLFKQLYNRFGTGDAATTETFLSCLGECLGRNEMEAFKKELYLKNYYAVKKEDIVRCDSVWFGKWSGPLTQFGSTTSFVLNLLPQDGAVVPVLDSPDQGAYNIPLYGLIIKNDSISFVVGVASGLYSGKLEQAKNVIEGTWSQRGNDYPLVLTHEK